ncbi:MAG: hypothetical protein ACTMUB_02310 [cyanobacterium endosymbiont of Rhopalodia musculus]|nr:hypothetical protein [cyanobacterium endosymbiont of Epithemia clementina EcSB]WGT67064.1 hypothetical protein P3F56_07475 [cyanobacterium endosymbiont of Epithemia clementina EcSB]
MLLTKTGRERSPPETSLLARRLEITNYQGWSTSIVYLLAQNTTLTRFG